MSYADAFVNRKRESFSKLQHHQDYLSKLIKDFNLQIEDDKPDGFDTFQNTFQTFKKKDTPEKPETARPIESNAPGSPGILSDVAKIIEKTKNRYRDWNAVEQQFLQTNKPQPKKVDNTEQLKEADDLISKIKNRLFSVEEDEDPEPKAVESTAVSKNVSKASFDLLKVSECVSVDVSEATNRKPEESTKNQTDLEHSTEVSHFTTERKSVKSEENAKKPISVAAETQDPIERINQALGKSQLKPANKKSEVSEKREVLKEIQNNLPIESNSSKKSEANSSKISEAPSTTKKKPIGENLPNLGAQRKMMQSQFKERFAQLKHHYKAEIKVEMPPTSTTSKKSINAGDRSFQRENEADVTRVQTGKLSFKDEERMAEESLEVSQSSMIEEKEEEEKVRSEMKRPPSLPKTIDRYDNLRIDLLDESYVKKRLQGEIASTPHDQQNLFITPLKNVSNFEENSELNYSHSLQEASFLLTDVAKHRVQKKSNKIEDYELTDQDKKVLEERFQSDLELQKLLKKRVFVQNKLEALRLQRK